MINRRHFQAAMSASAGALLFTIAGFSGYVLNWHAASSWGYRTGAPVWWEVGLGLGLAAVAAVYWRNVITRADSPPIRDNR
jgi:membrane protein implicated in regulation of membrane protease activity